MLRRIIVLTVVMFCPSLVSADFTVKGSFEKADTKRKFIYVKVDKAVKSYAYHDRTEIVDRYAKQIDLSVFKVGDSIEIICSPTSKVRRLILAENQSQREAREKAEVESTQPLALKKTIQVYGEKFNLSDFEIHNPYQELSVLKIGQFGIPVGSYKVDDIVGAMDMTLTARSWDKSIRIHGVSTKGLTDDSKGNFEGLPPIAIIGTHTYTTVLGGSRTILLAVPISMLTDKPLPESRSRGN